LSLLVLPLLLCSIRLSRDAATASTNTAPAAAASAAVKIISGHLGLLRAVAMSKAAVMEPSTRRWGWRHSVCSTQLLVHLQKQQQSCELQTNPAMKMVIQNMS
jgi:hypothetical protein